MATSDSQDRFRAILAAAAAVGTIAFNILAVMGYVNGVTPKQVSAKYESVLTPAGYAFTIWTLIYVGILAFSVYQLLPSNNSQTRRVRTLFIASCVLNCGWIYFWHQERIGLCAAIIALFAVVLGVITFTLRDADTYRDALFTSAPFGLYFGWVTCAALVNLIIWLEYAGLLPKGYATVAGIIFIVIAAAFAVGVRVMAGNFIYPLAVAWALTAIGVKQSGNTGLVIAAAMGTMTALITAGSVVTRLKDSTSG